ncbi:hypothetical protein SCARD494_13407 [Seiridium cardinale]
MGVQLDYEHWTVPKDTGSQSRIKAQSRHFGGDSATEDEDSDGLVTLFDTALSLTPLTVDSEIPLKTEGSSALVEPSPLLPSISAVEPSPMAQREAGTVASSNRPSSPSQWLLEALHREAFGFRPAYRGNVLNVLNRPQQVPAQRNCNLWLTNLPDDCKESDLEEAIMNVGSIFAMYINPPNKDEGHSGSAASLAFTRIESARELVTRARWEGVWVKGRRARITWNRNRVGEQYRDSPQSRVLIINGPREVVNETTLTEFFGRYCSFRTAGIVKLHRDERGYATIEWRFARISGQASVAAACLEALRDEHGVDVVCFWGLDPCEESSRLKREYMMAQELASRYNHGMRGVGEFESYIELGMGRSDTKGAEFMKSGYTA